MGVGQENRLTLEGMQQNNKAEIRTDAWGCPLASTLVLWHAYDTFVLSAHIYLHIAINTQRKTMENIKKCTSDTYVNR